MADIRATPQAQEQDAIFRGTGGGELSLKANTKDTMLTALVDGGFVHRFRG